MSEQNTAIVLATDNYPAVTTDVSSLAEIFSGNLGGETLGFKDLRRVKVPSGGGKTWNADSDNPMDSTKSFQAVIAHTELGRVMWLKELGSGVPATAPDCTGKPDADGVWHGSRSRAWIGQAAASLQLAPMNAGYSQDNSPQECEGCELAKFGSGRGGRGQKCQIKRSFYLATEDSLLPTALIAPVMSLANAKKYLLGLSTSNPALQYHEVVTEFGLEVKTANNQTFAVITFAKSMVLPPEQRVKFAHYRKAIQKLVGNMNVSRAVFAEQPVAIDMAEFPEDELLPGEDD